MEAWLAPVFVQSEKVLKSLAALIIQYYLIKYMQMRQNATKAKASTDSAFLLNNTLQDV